MKSYNKCFGKNFLFLITVLMMTMLVACSQKTTTDTTEASATEAATTATTTAAAETKAEESVTSEEIDFPTQDIKWLVPYPVGSATDLPARIMQKSIDPLVETNTIIVNMEGSAGTVALAELANSAPDGYTIMSGLTSVQIPYILGSIDILPYEDLEVIGQYNRHSTGIVVRADSEYETLEDLIEDARQNPGKLNIGGSFNNIQQISLLELKKLSGVDFNVVEVGGTTVKAPELLSGRVDAYADSVSAAAPYIESGEFKFLCILSDERDEKFFPDIPTAKESGYDVNCDVTYGWYAPKGTPQEIIDKLAKILEEACSSQECADELESLYTYPEFLSGPEYIEVLKADYIRLEEILAGLQ